MTVRKYISEFGLNMFGTLKVLLQQDDFEHLEKPEVQAEFVEHPCHIYMVCRCPRIVYDPKSFAITEQAIRGKFLIQRGPAFEPHPFKLANKLGISQASFDCPYPHSRVRIRDASGNFIHGSKAAYMARFDPNMWDHLTLEVLYIGQSYGVDGARTAPQRLRSHETLQGIYAEAISRSPDQEVWLVLCSFEPLLLASFDGRKQEYGTNFEEDDQHIDTVLSNDITEQQQINFTEAALIRYFQPEYNQVFKNSFPNPAHRTYTQCYDLDLNTISVELNTEDLRSRLRSAKVPARWIHFATFPLHSSAERRSMFDFA